MTGPSKNLKFDLSFPASHKQYDRYLNVLERDAAKSVARFAGLQFRYVVTTSMERTTYLLESGYGSGVSKYTPLDVDLKVRVGQVERDT